MSGRSQTAQSLALKYPYIVWHSSSTRVHLRQGSIALFECYRFFWRDKKPTEFGPLAQGPPWVGLSGAMFFFKSLNLKAKT